MKVDVFECRKCKSTKVLDDFPTDNSRRNRKHPYCKDCHKKYWRNERSGRPGTKDIAKRAARKFACNKYGLAVEQYDGMLEQQNGTCAICGEKCYQSLCIDHDHETGLVRGLLCMKCNTGLGKFKTIEQLQKAISYLEKSKCA